MKICFVTPYSPRVVGGVGTFVTVMIRSLEEKGIDHIILTKDVKDGKDFSGHIFEIEVSKIRYVRSLELTIKMILLIVKNREQIDIIHLQTTNHLLAPIVFIGKILRIPVLTTIHGKIPHGKTFPMKQLSIIAEQMILNFSDQIIYVSNDTYRYYDDKRNKGGLVILNGIDIAKYYFDKKRRIKMRLRYNVENSFVILFVGRLTSTKGIYELLEALSKLKSTINTNFWLINVGLYEGDDIDRYLEVVERLNLGEMVANVQQQEDIAEFYNMGDVFILPSHTEGLPYALLEAMASEMTVIATDVGDIGAVIEHGRNGLLIKLKNPNDIQEKLLWCINNQEESRKLGMNARNTVKTKFNLDLMVESYIKIYKKLYGPIR
ncbi:MAG: glycosyltransferase family 4 protein [Thermoplasmata archaeon]|nr:MAG: glycosyltransferase family 4 protein [Thermoplasmata archaeon]